MSNKRKLETELNLQNDEASNEKKVQDEEEEPMLKENKNRFVLFPIVHTEIWKMYKKHEASFWPAEEIDLSKDEKDWVTLKPEEQHFIKYVIAFFAASDGIVLENLAQNFLMEVQYPEARCFYGFQIMMENIHSETYSLLLDTYIKNQAEKLQLLNAIETIPSIAKKAQWALKWMDKNQHSFEQRLIAFAMVEGIFFSGSFCCIFWIKKRGLMPGLTFSNELISRDEALHCEFAILLYHMLKYKKVPHETIQEMAKEAYEIEGEYICEAIEKDLIGMNVPLMKQYIQFVTDDLIQAFHVSTIFNVCNPFEWMELISLCGKTNFFEKKVGEYQKAGVMSLPSNIVNPFDPKIIIDF